MKTDIDNLDLFCRINVQSDLPHQDFIAFIAHSVGGTSRWNLVETDRFEALVDKNDDFDAEKSQNGPDRWLHFRYTLEIEPIKGVSPSDYMAAIGSLLQSLWSSGMDAVAACEFEEQLPRNVRRLKWAGVPPPHTGDAGAA